MAPPPWSRRSALALLLALYIYIYIYIHICTIILTLIFMIQIMSCYHYYVCVYIYIYIYICICMYIYIYIYTYIYIYVYVYIRPINAIISVTYRSAAQTPTHSGRSTSRVGLTVIVRYYTITVLRLAPRRALRTVVQCSIVQYSIV